MDRNANDNSTQQSVVLACFEKRGGSTYVDMAYVAFAVLTIIPIVIVMSAVLAFEGMKVSLLSGLLIVCTVTVLSTWILWRWAVSRLRFCLIFYSDYLQVGRGLAKLVFPYDSVEIISLPLTVDEGTFVRVKCGIKSAKVHLSTQEVLECLSLLREYCVNAIFIDSKGREHPPENPSDYDRPLRVLERIYKRRLPFCIVLGLWFAGVCLASVWHLVSRPNGNLPDDKILRMWIAAIGSGVAASVFFFVAIKSSFMLANIRRSKALASTGPNDSNNNSRVRGG